ncbi:MAG: SDR family oxidoreductase [Anaerolineae bacterium]|nr:SDR family oxidoreductase [Anaerolineae bacterium]
MSSDKLLPGKVALITGAGSNIGRALATGFAREGAAVGCAGRTLSRLEETVRLIEVDGGRGLAVQADVTQIDQVERMMAATVETFGGLDILVVNAGGTWGQGPVETYSQELWLQTIDVNLNGAFYCAQKAIPHLKERGGGKIITIGSGAGHTGIDDLVAYNCAKAGLWMLTRMLSRELMPYNITVNELIPGPVREPTRLPLNTLDPEKWSDNEWIKSPEDVVPLALFLATQPDAGPTGRSFSLMRRGG